MDFFERLRQMFSKQKPKEMPMPKPTPMHDPSMSDSEMNLIHKLSERNRRLGNFGRKE